MNYCGNSYTPSPKLVEHVRPAPPPVSLALVSSPREENIERSAGSVPAKIILLPGASETSTETPEPPQRRELKQTVAEKPDSPAVRERGTETANRPNEMAAVSTPADNGQLGKSDLETAVFIMARGYRVPPTEIAKRLGWTEDEILRAVGRLTLSEKGDLLLKLVQP